MRILFLHGFTQNGSLFARKASAIRKALTKAGHNADFIDAPYTVDEETLPFEAEKGIDMRSWWEPNEQSPDFMNLDKAFGAISDYVNTNGTIDGIVGFSQGAGLAAVVSKQLSKIVPDHPPLKFCVLYSGFCFREPYHQCFYESPFDTHALHVVGSLDTVVSEERSMKLWNAWNPERRQLLQHPGGHYVPSTKPTVNVVMNFINHATTEKRSEAEEGAPVSSSTEDWDEFDSIGKA